MALKFCPCPIVNLHPRPGDGKQIIKADPIYGGDRWKRKSTWETVSPHYANRIFSLPMHPYLVESDQELIIGALAGI